MQSTNDVYYSITIKFINNICSITDCFACLGLGYVYVFLVQYDIYYTDTFAEIKFNLFIIIFDVIIWYNI